jgi:hypothetical protein
MSLSLTAQRPLLKSNLDVDVFLDGWPMRSPLENALH